jgi:hypothetical protein
VSVTCVTVRGNVTGVRPPLRWTTLYSECRKKSLHASDVTERLVTRDMDRSAKTTVSSYSVSVACDRFEQNLQVARRLWLCCFVLSRMHLRLYTPSCAVGSSVDLPSSPCLCIRSNITFFRFVNQIIPGVFISTIKPVFTSCECLKAFCLRRHFLLLCHCLQDSIHFCF